MSSLSTPVRFGIHNPPGTSTRCDRQFVAVGEVPFEYSKRAHSLGQRWPSPDRPDGILKAITNANAGEALSTCSCAMRLYERG